MRKKTYPIIAIVLFLVGCTSLPAGQKLGTSVASPLPSEATVQLLSATPFARTPTPIPSATSLPTVEPELPTAIAPHSVSFDQESGTKITSDRINSECIGPQNISETDSAIGKGLMVANITKNEFDLWGDVGLESVPSIPRELYSEIVRSAWWPISPDGQWILSTVYKKNSNFDVSILNIKTGSILQHHFEGVEAGHVSDYWGDQNHIILPLANQVDLFEWLIWNPLTQAVNKVSARLPGIGGVIDDADSTHVYIYPVYDYPAGLVIYACKACGENEYQAFDPQTGRLQWGIDLGSAPLSSAQDPPIVSPDGKYFAIYFGLNKIWILNSQGESVLKSDPTQQRPGSSRNGTCDHLVAKWEISGVYPGFHRSQCPLRVGLIAGGKANE